MTNRRASHAIYILNLLTVAKVCLQQVSGAAMKSYTTIVKKQKQKGRNNRRMDIEKMQSPPTASLFSVSMSVMSARFVYIRHWQASV